jgi:TonB family protein
MKALLLACLIGSLFSASLFAQVPGDAKARYDLEIARLGVALSEAEAIKVESEIDRFSSHRDAHLALAWFWLREARVNPRPAAFESRLRHFLWLLNSDPLDPLFRRREIPLQFSGGAAADQEGLGQLAAVWERHLAAREDDKDLLLAAAGWLKYSHPERAFDLFRQAGDPALFGEFCGKALAGSYQADTRDSLPDTELTRKFSEQVAKSTDIDFLANVMRSLHTHGSDRYLAEKITFDYTGPLRQHLPTLQQSEKYGSEFSGQYTARFPPQQPSTQQRLRIGGSIMRDRTLRIEQPDYPALVQRKGIEGTVRLNVLVSKEGTVQQAEAVSGPEALRGFAEAAVLQWEYLPVFLNGEPIEVSTVVDLHFRLNNQRTPEP